MYTQMNIMLNLNEKHKVKIKVLERPKGISSEKNLAESVK